MPRGWAASASSLPFGFGSSCLLLCWRRSLGSAVILIPPMTNAGAAIERKHLVDALEKIKL